MLLSEIAFLDEFIEKNGNFSNLHMCYSDKESTLTYCEERIFLIRAEKNINISCIIIIPELVSDIPENRFDGIVVCDNPKKLFYEVHNYLVENTDFYNLNISYYISKTASIHPSAVLATKNVVIGENVVIGPGVCIFENTIIEDDVVIQANCSIGPDGFQYVRLKDSIMSVKHDGGVRIGKGVRIEAQTCVDKGMFKVFTTIDRGSKIGNLVLIGHNDYVGKNCLITGCVCLCGSVAIGDNCWLGPGSLVCNGVRIGDNCFIGMGAVVKKTIGNNLTVSDNPARSLDFLCEEREIMNILRKAYRKGILEELLRNKI